MPNADASLSNDPAVLKAMITTLRAENDEMSATLRAHDQLIQSLRVRIAKLRKQAFGASSEKIEREIAQLELALCDNEKLALRQVRQLLCQLKIGAF